MRDLTEGSINRHLVAMASPIAAGMLFQTLYFLVDLYFVGRLGGAAIAGVGSAGNLTFLVMALTQVLGVGTVALIAQAVGRKDKARANLVFNQSSTLAMACLLACLLLGYPLAVHFAGALGSDQATREAGATYLRWYLPGLSLQFALVAMASALRGTGIVKPAMTAQMLTVVINVILAPVLIGGWGTGHPLGVAGAGLASSIAIAVGVLLMWVYFLRLEHYVGFDRHSWRPRLEVWRQILAIGLPAGGEFVIMFVIFSFIYFVIRPFGASAQAGFGVGTRVMQAIFLPAMAVAFAVAPIVGQNFRSGPKGAGAPDVPLGGAYERVADAGCHGPVPGKPGVVDRNFYQRTRSDPRGLGLPPGDLLELRRERFCLRVLWRVAGPGQYVAGAMEFRFAPDHLYRAGLVADDATGFLDHPDLDGIGGVRNAAGAVERYAGASPDAPAFVSTVSAGATARRKLRGSVTEP